MKFVEVQVTEDEYEALKPYGTKWIRTGRKVIAIEPVEHEDVTLNFILPTTPLFSELSVKADL
ncbi:MAG: hypothetical protein KAX31_02595, partial [Thermoplasmata archaeon]|nr:hypothetical protein [Thermoplasmata archaeon]